MTIIQLKFDFEATLSVSAIFHACGLKQHRSTSVAAAARACVERSIRSIRSAKRASRHQPPISRSLRSIFLVQHTTKAAHAQSEEFPSEFGAYNYKKLCLMVH